MGPSLLISVVVCTYNRSVLLPGVLQSLCEQTLATARYQIIVVDNNSVDNTRAVTEEFCRRYANVRYQFEPRQGLSHARNRGWQVAQGEYVAYIDDDCKAPPEWLAVAKDVIERVSPAAFGGPSFPIYEAAKPRWYKDSYIAHVPYTDARALKGEECVKIYGHNMFFRRSLLENLGGFDPRLGMSGQNIAYGEETALLRLIAGTMPHELIYYEPRLYVYNLVRPDKMTFSWMARAAFASGRMCYHVFGATAGAGGRRQLALKTIETLLAFAKSVLASTMRWNRRQYPYIQNYWYDHVFPHLQKLGMLYEVYRGMMQRPRFLSG